MHQNPSTDATAAIIPWEERRSWRTVLISGHVVTWWDGWVHVSVVWVNVISKVIVMLELDKESNPESMNSTRLLWLRPHLVFKYPLLMTRRKVWIVCIRVTLFFTRRLLQLYPLHRPSTPPWWNIIWPWHWKTWRLYIPLCIQLASRQHRRSSLLHFRGRCVQEKWLMWRMFSREESVHEWRAGFLKKNINYTTSANFQGYLDGFIWHVHLFIRWAL